MAKAPDLQEAFGVHAGRVYNYFRRMVPGRETARDLAQETFVRAIHASSRYRGEAPVEVWLLGIARNVFREWSRRHREDPVARPHMEEAAAPTGSVERLDVERALARLVPEQREVLVLRFVLELSGEETANLLGISHDAVRQRVARAKAEFRRLWES